MKFQKIPIKIDKIFIQNKKYSKFFLNIRIITQRSSLHIAASRYIDIDHLVTRDNSNESVMELLKKIFSKEQVL